MQDATTASADIEFTDIDEYRNTGGQPASAESLSQPMDHPEPSEAIRGFSVALAIMPFYSYFWPSLPMGLLKVPVRQAGFPVEDYYLNLDLAEQLGFDFYEEIQNYQGDDPTGEWLFSVAAFREESSREDYLSKRDYQTADIAAKTGKDTEALNDLRERVLPAFIEECADRIGQRHRAVALFATVEQNVASLALARRIKEKYPHVATIITCFEMGSEEGVDMALEYMRSFPYIDYFFVEDSREVTRLLTLLAEGGDVDSLPGLVRRRGDSVTFCAPDAPPLKLDNLPVPDYDTYFGASKRLGISARTELASNPMTRFLVDAIPIFGSFGCWWGNKSQCCFCGNSSSGRAYQRRPPEQLLSEIEQLSIRYGRKRFFGIDSALDIRYVDGLFGPLAEKNAGYEFCFFTRASFTREQIRLLAKGGLKQTYTGVESLNTHVLKLMRKGTTKLQNINMIRWCTYYDIMILWNLLHGFPGETCEDYADELATLRLLAHLPPPVCLYRTRLQRFSPMFREKEAFATKWQRPASEYTYIYPASMNLDRIAYKFEHEFVAELVPEEAYDETRRFVMDWRQAWSVTPRAALTYRRTDSGMVIHDTRGGTDPRTFTLYDSDADIYEAFSSAPRSPVQVAEMLSSARPELDVDVETAASACDSFCEAGLMIRDSGKFLSLAMPAEPGL
jgi:ribosomal peptide maturation radical SAM protein 1